MAVKMRLMRMGKKKSPSYRVVVVDGRAPRDGRYIEQIGRYDPKQEPSLVEIDNEKATSWLSKGAQPTEAVEKLLNISGAMNTMKMRTGQIHTVGAATSPVSSPPVATAEEGPDRADVEPAPAAAEAAIPEEPAAEEIAADTATEEE
ncbi:MAG: 30S ribosomal protein S16 [Acidimicrobiia bacterium]